MKKFLSILCLGLALFSASPANATINIFACEPEWGALAEEIGGDKVKVTNAITAHEDPHHVKAKPSLIAAIRNADVVICSGAGLEVGWLPILMQKSGAGVQTGQPGNIMVADYVTVQGKPGAIDRSMGDIHPEGNPHLHLDPHNIGIAGGVLAQRLAEIDSSDAAYFQQRGKDFSTRWNADISRWQQEAASLKGLPVVVHHEGWLYLENWLGLKRVAALEPKPGIPPTISHLEEVLQAVKQHPAKAIIRTPYEEAKASEWLAEKSSIKALQLPYTVGGDDKATSLEAMFDDTITLLKGAAN